MNRHTEVLLNHARCGVAVYRVHSCVHLPLCSLTASSVFGINAEHSSNVLARCGLDGLRGRTRDQDTRIPVYRLDIRNRNVDYKLAVDRDRIRPTNEQEKARGSSAASTRGVERGTAIVHRENRSAGTLTENARCAKDS